MVVVGYPLGFIASSNIVSWIYGTRDGLPSVECLLSPIRQLLAISKIEVPELYYWRCLGRLIILTDHRFLWLGRTIDTINSFFFSLVVCIAPSDSMWMNHQGGNFLVNYSWVPPRYMPQICGVMSNRVLSFNFTPEFMNSN